MTTSTTTATVETQPSTASAGSGLTTERLAIYGGPAAMTRKYRERWRKIRTWDMLQILWYAIRDVNTLPTGGGPIGRFEQRFAQLAGTKYALSMNSGTAALHSAYMSVGIGPGDEVLVPSYTFFASAAPIFQCGGTPVFCDIDSHTLTIDPDDLEARITTRTKAICVVHIWGNPARMDRIAEIARKHNLALIEDCSHGPGATFQDRPVGSWGDIGCFSLQGTKAISGGEAGIAVTSNPTLYDHMLALGHFNRTATDQQNRTFDIENLSLGLKYRPHLFAILMAAGGLRRLPELNRLRRKNYEILSTELAGCPALEPIESYPDSIPGGILAFVLKYRAEHAGNWPRGAFVKAAVAEGVPVSVDYYRPLHRRALFNLASFGNYGGALRSYSDRQQQPAAPDDLTTTEEVCQQLVTVTPMTKVSPDLVRQCAQALRKVANGAAQIKDLRTGR